jgi:hypothetical protein
LNRLDTANISNWSIQDNLQVGDTVYGDRANVFTAVPTVLHGAERIQVAANTRVLQSDTAEFIAREDIFVYIGLDARRNSADLSWLNTADTEWQATNMTITATDQTAPDGPGITYNLYRIALASGESIRLGTNGPAGGVIMYTVFVTADDGDSGSVPFIRRELTLELCEECGIEKRFTITTLGIRLAGGDEIITTQRRAAKRNSSGQLLAPCEHSFRWEG